ncbi:hypothetical protein [Kibdelosporangium phytohabitans]|uniref:Integral membrane protein n=1 Tax=Kibdelosporangium phytohabitans TaxID=860235 RepID=A0A0N9HUS5_9PSEU|nr:hypothetical protein [Kibdelosporangium phytohabitans]ALG08776.1 hypothetical protein AOZ06_19305 [Kibdelosporangium phytohabitans]MBE1470097.1 uncharacterized membrane protein YgaE (UPF0421/DUF939 family) [Kibdelosporangium phytohabitans]
MKRLLSVLVGALAAGAAGYVKSGDEATASGVALAFAIPIAISTIALPGLRALVPAAVYVASMLVFGPSERAEGANILSGWALLWMCCVLAAILVTVSLLVSRRRKTSRTR